MFRWKAIFRPCLLAALCCPVLLTEARADEKIVQATTIDSPALESAVKQMSPDQRAKMAEMGMSGTRMTTAYFIRGHARIDMGSKSFIYDGPRHKEIAIDRAAHLYTIRSYMPAATTSEQMKGVTAGVRATGDKKMILGHSATRYAITMAVTDPREGPSIIKGNVWIAHDIPQQEMASVAAGPAGAILTVLKKQKGMPLDLDLVISSSSTGRITVKVVTKSLSSSPLPSSIFAIPAGYAPTAAGAGITAPGSIGR